MPELPEVETTVRGINTHLKGLEIRDIWTDYSSHIHRNKNHIKSEIFFPLFKKTIIGAEVIRAHRRAKNVLIDLSNGYTILVHMKMTGHLLYGKYHYNQNASKDPWEAIEKGPLQDPFNRFIHLVFTLSNDKHLTLSDVRKFAKVTLLKTSELKQMSDLRELGPEPLLRNFSSRVMKERLLQKPKGKIKTVLMDQSIIAGIGNIYSDEILFASGVHPLSRVEKIPDNLINRMWKNTKDILKKGIAFKGDSLSDYRNIDGRPGKFQYEHKAYRQTKKGCLKKGCPGVIERLKIGGRSAHFCSTHQKLYD